jgi:hypothetical protein
MRTIFTGIVFLYLAGIALSADSPQYTFSFTVQVDDEPPVSLNASILPGTSQTLQATEHLRVEIEAPTAIGDSSMTVVRLVDDSTGNPIALHTAHTVGPIAMVRSFGYAVCDGVTKYQSPLQSSKFGCKTRTL